MSWAVRLSSHAQREFRKLPRDIQPRIEALVLSLAAEPRPPGCLKLSGTANQWRIRLGDYRIKYEIRSEEELVWVISVGQREGFYDR
ncbi:type II toxin-antitoxin system RelE/ParE family toxin [bacterium]|nr:type II toxin-antitoxin system RelE/ParE family toxin [bacterium]